LGILSETRGQAKKEMRIPLFSVFSLCHLCDSSVSLWWNLQNFTPETQRITEATLRISKSDLATFCTLPEYVFVISQSAVYKGEVWGM